MADRELELRETSLATGQAILDAIDLASDQDQMTWITNGGKRIAAIVPVEQAEYGITQAEREVITAQSDDVEISASEFMALSLDKRRVLLDRFYARLHGGPSCPEPGS